MRILVVEDESHVAELIQQVLERKGMTCLLAEDAAEADRLLDSAAVDAVTLDLGIPGRGGLDWLEDVAEERPELASKTLVITGLGLESGLVERLARCGAGILAKPFTLDGLDEAIRNQIDRPGGFTRPR